MVVSRRSLGMPDDNELEVDELIAVTVRSMGSCLSNVAAGSRVSPAPGVEADWAWNLSGLASRSTSLSHRSSEFIAANVCILVNCRAVGGSGRLVHNKGRGREYKQSTKTKRRCLLPIIKGLKKN